MGFGTGLEYVLKSVLALIVIIFLANKLLGYMNTIMNKQTKAIRIIERMPVNKNSSMCIVEMLGSYYLMSFTEGRNEILKEFSEDESQAIIAMRKEKELSAGQSSLDTEQFKEIYTKIQEKIQTYTEKRN
ncbi:flagellar biosynthetic protein FliO [Desemzia sp. C1]|uniref:flagellar biosynthetic protein FliO n=1 Tax=Desemzia sp. C1 TaxID=2892016 RepID=UPI001E50D894|nr:flagellar biosynthetic protein FliO [Desemzia sp. C1]MCI3028085.1 flagellar biosynthetic protein FliO [Desemzia sp. C1]